MRGEEHADSRKEAHAMGDDFETHEMVGTRARSRHHPDGLVAGLGGSFPGDPADRFIVASALEHDAPLVTKISTSPTGDSSNDLVITRPGAAKPRPVRAAGQARSNGSQQIQTLGGSSVSRPGVRSGRGWTTVCCDNSRLHTAARPVRETGLKSTARIPSPSCRRTNCWCPG
jgi:hypothetical protein